MTAPLRTATPADVVRRLTGTLYRETAETALGGGMGDAQLGIGVALNEAIDAGLVRVMSVRDTTYGKGIRFLALAPVDTDETIRCRHGRALVGGFLGGPEVQHDG